MATYTVCFKTYRNNHLVTNISPLGTQCSTSQSLNSGQEKYEWLNYYESEGLSIDIFPIKKKKPTTSPVNILGFRE